MKIFVNNIETETAATTVEALHAELNLPDKGVAIAINNRVVLRTSWATQALTEGDYVTIIKAAFGG